ncbi:MAG TPA: DUF5703 domain-containing protein, partial [Verrucomicrobiae bacterium]
MKTAFVLGAAFALVSMVPPTAAAPVDAFNLVWDSPSVNHHGSMPLGNGDVALNAWMTTEGGLQFYISKADAWDDNARLVKVGKVRVHFEPNPLASGRPFRQELKLNEGCIEVLSGGRTQAKIRLWVDANHPVIHVTADSAMPIEATASIELWRTNQCEVTELQVSDAMMNRKVAHKGEAATIVEPDTVLSGERDRIGWFHHNVKSVGPRMMAEVQGLTGFTQPDPLLHRTFGAVVKAAGGERLDDLRLRSPLGKSHRFSVYVLTRHPSTPEHWLAEMDDRIRRVEAQDFKKRQIAHETWWNEFWNRSWIRASVNPNARPALASIAPTNEHPVRIGSDQRGGNKFEGELDRISVFAKPLSRTEIVAQACSGISEERRQILESGAGLRPSVEPPLQALFSGTNLTPQILSGSVVWDFSAGFTIEAWVKPARLGAGGARILDKITPGQRDGFLFDTHPGNSLRFICGDTELTVKDALPPDQWTHVAAVADSAAGYCRLYVNGKPVAESMLATVRDEAAYVSQMYHFQRFITACAGRGAFPIKFNGSLFTVPTGDTEKDPDYRRWGPGYWWQNTRLPYISLCASGDFDLQHPLFRMYADELLPLCKFRTRHYLGHDGAFYPECIMFWGAIFSETYGWTPFEQRADKLQESGWHKWEWVGGLELAWMMLDYYDHTLDRDFLRQTALPFAREILTFFEQHYPTNAQGKLVMYPSQALETWWHCTNAAPELGGCIALTERLLAIPANLTPASDRELWQSLSAKLPPLPVHEINGKKALAPAEF